MKTKTKIEMTWTKQLENEEMKNIIKKKIEKKHLTQKLKTKKWKQKIKNKNWTQNKKMEIWKKMIFFYMVWNKPQ